LFHKPLTSFACIPTLDDWTTKSTNEESPVKDDRAPVEPIEYEEILPAAAHPAGDSILAINTVDQSVRNDQVKEAFGEVPVKEGSASSSRYY